MARRRDHEAEARRQMAGGPPEELRSMAGVQAFYVADEPVPPWWTAQREAQTWRSLAAYGRWSRARKQWAVDSGADYVATFYPHWRQHGAAS